MLSRELKTRCCGSIVPARAAFADQGNRIYGGAGFLGGEAWRAAVGNVCERTVGFGREALEGGGVHQEDQIPAAGRERRASREKEQLKRAAGSARLEAQIRIVAWPGSPKDLIPRARNRDRITVFPPN